MPLLTVSDYFENTKNVCTLARKTLNSHDCLLQENLTFDSLGPFVCIG